MCSFVRIRNEYGKGWDGTIGVRGEDGEVVFGYPGEREREKKERGREGGRRREALGKMEVRA